MKLPTSAYPLSGGLREAIALQNQWGTANQRYQRICHLSTKLWQALGQIPSVQCLHAHPPAAGLVSFQLTQGMPHSEAVQSLETQGIYVRTIVYPDCIRACVHYLTTEAEVGDLVNAIARL
ncbi:MAG: hypothetical protein HC825_06505 [Oscillatoriales cyanobacterium RM1_1_9]|nr:hypothetical protein [Oscillatoriales cyanobacterium RM1_1_9]